LHDANGRVWTDAELNDYINDGRKRIAIDTHCLRSLESVTLTTSTESFTVSALTSKGERVFDITNLTVLWGSQRVPLEWYAWTQFNALYRPWSINLGRPTVWSFYGTSPATQQIYIQPVPDENYTAQMDCFYIPVDLVDDTTVDELAYPFTDPVAYYAASKAKEGEQAYGEAEQFMRQYAKKAIEAINSFTRRLQSAYQ
jgi:hypothetical protein